MFIGTETKHLRDCACRSLFNVDIFELLLTYAEASLSCIHIFTLKISTTKDFTNVGEVQLCSDYGNKQKALFQISIALSCWKQISAFKRFWDNHSNLRLLSIKLGSFGEILV